MLFLIRKMGGGRGGAEREHRLRFQCLKQQPSFFPEESLLWMNWSSNILSSSELCNFPGGSDGKESNYNARDPGLIPGSGTSLGGGNSNPLQYSFWRTSRTEEPGRLRSTGLQRVRHNWATNTNSQLSPFFHFNLSLLYLATSRVHEIQLLNLHLSSVWWYRSHAVELGVWNVTIKALEYLTWLKTEPIKLNSENSSYSLNEPSTNHHHQNKTVQESRNELRQGYSGWIVIFLRRSIKMFSSLQTTRSTIWLEK